MRNLLDVISDGVIEAITDAKLECCVVAHYTYNCPAGHIDITVDKNDSAEVVVCPDNDKGRSFPRLEEAIINCLPFWADVELFW